MKKTTNAQTKGHTNAYSSLPGLTEIKFSEIPEKTAHATEMQDPKPLPFAL